MGCFGGGSFMNTGKTATSRPAVKNAGAFAPDKERGTHLAGILFIISAPSGSGKSTLVNELRKYQDGLQFSVSYTTRAPRGSEVDGREYHFITRDEFKRMVAAGEFLEYAEVFGNYYGTARRSLGRGGARGQGSAARHRRAGRGAGSRERCQTPSASSLCRQHRRSSPPGCATGAAQKAMWKKRLSIAGWRKRDRKLRIIVSTFIFWSTTYWIVRSKSWQRLFSQNVFAGTKAQSTPKQPG